MSLCDPNNPGAVNITTEHRPDPQIGDTMTIVRVDGAVVGGIVKVVGYYHLAEHCAEVDERLVWYGDPKKFSEESAGIEWLVADPRKPHPRQTAAERNMNTLLAALPALGVDVPAGGFRVKRTRAGRWQRSQGAWSWWLKSLTNQHTIPWIGSQCRYTDIVRAARQGTLVGEWNGAGLELSVDELGNDRGAS